MYKLDFLIFEFKRTGLVLGCTQQTDRSRVIKARSVREQTTQDANFKAPNPKKRLQYFF